MSVHVAVLRQPYLQAVLDGRKTIESRLSKVMGPPHGMVLPGERIYFKQSGGPFGATAVAAEVIDHDAVTPALVAEVERKYRPAIGGDDEYWQAKRAAAYVTLIRLRDVEPMDVGPAFRAINMKAWYVLGDGQDIVSEHVLTEGNVRNHHVLFPAAARPVVADGGRRAAGDEVTLQLPDGQRVTTDIARGRMLRWRGWGRYFEAFGVGPGDRVRFVATPGGDYRVMFRPAPGPARGATPCPPLPPPQRRRSTPSPTPVSSEP